MPGSGGTQKRQERTEPVSEEKRKHLRSKCERITFFATHDHLYEGQVRNISLGGVYIESGNSFYPGEKITVAIPCPSNPHGEKLKEPYKDEEIKMKCVVVWKDPDGFGLRFIRPK
ncbi:MAG: hypothetical protein AMJ54_03540 [Deltaproteobacteria bacterium SG8_13]|nr:MAG: hypothetical protein AMJ54_03540 [Deltaproteobacteria bacterium SG8_13]